MKKKFLALLLAALMVVSLLPAVALAIEEQPGSFTELQELICNAEDAGTITLSKDYEYGGDDDEALIIKTKENVGKTLTIDMNGHKITGGEYGCFSIDKWIDSGTSKLILTDTSVSGGGTISCADPDDQAIYLDIDGTLFVSNITFSGCGTAIYNSDGCVIIENCEFTSNNYAVENFSKMAVTDTTITNNEVGICNRGDLYIGGLTTVSENETNILIEKDTYKYTGDGAWADEIYDFCPITLGNGTAVSALGDYVVAAPSNDFSAGITMREYEDSTPMYYDTDNSEYYPDWEKSETVKDNACAGAFTTNGTADDAKYFFSDSPDYEVSFNTNHLELKAAGTSVEHTHSFTYSASGAVLTATCTATDCDLHATPTTLTLTAPANPVYDNKAKVVTFADGEESAWTAAGCATPSDIAYYLEGGTTKTSVDETEDGKAPINAGKYVAKVKVDTNKTAELAFEITKAASAKPTNVKATDITKNSVTLTKNSAWEYSMDGSTWQDSNVFNGLEEGTKYTFSVRVKATDNVEASESATVEATTEKSESPVTPSNPISGLVKAVVKTAIKTVVKTVTKVVSSILKWF